MRGAAVLVALVASAGGGPAVAQPSSCAPCDRGNALIDRFKLEAVRQLAPQLATLALVEPLTSAQYTTILDLKKREPTLGRLGALDDTSLALVAAALCREPDSECTAATARALRCLANRCDVQLPAPDPRNADVVSPLPECRRSSYYTRKRSPPIGIGIDWGNGWERSRYANDGRAWSLGIEGRMAVGGRRGVVVRADRTAGRDAGTDSKGNGADDFDSGSITRFTALAGPSFVLDATSYDRTTRFLRLDLLAGYTATLSQPGDDGLVAGFDLGLQVGPIRVGTRFVQGVGDASRVTMALVHFGVSTGSVPHLDDDDDECPRTPFRRKRSSRLALGFELPVPLGGVGFSEQLGYIGGGVGVELVAKLTRRIDAVTHADVLVYPGHERERVIHQALLGGLRIDHGGRKRRRSRGGFLSTIMSGYTHGAGLEPTTTGSGPVVDLSLGWGYQDSETLGYLRLHGRFGLGAENQDYRAVFLSAGFEMRFDPDRWRDRVRNSY